LQSVVAFGRRAGHASFEDTGMAPAKFMLSVVRMLTRPGC
jgi:hypothetical protein